MESDFDEGSFKKARSFLMVFSTMLLALWYFEAEMSTLSLLGNSIKFTANTHDLWLMLALANLYFFCRYVQHLPNGWDKPDFDTLYHATLCRFTKTFYQKQILAAAWNDFKGDHNVAGITGFIVKPVGHLLNARNPVTEEFDFSPKQARVIFQMPTTWIDTDGGKRESTGGSTVVAPHIAIVVAARSISFLKGLYLTPWFTEHLFPMLYALCAIGVGFWSWHILDTPEPTVPIASPAQTSMQSPQAIRCISETIQTKRSMLSVACAPAPTAPPDARYQAIFKLEEKYPPHGI